MLDSLDEVNDNIVLSLMYVTLSHTFMTSLCAMTP